MSQNEKRLFDRHKKQEEPPLEQTQAVPAVQDEITAEPAAEVLPKRNKYADKMNRKKRRLSKGARIGITAAAVALLLGGGILQVGHGLLTQGQQVHRLRGHDIPLVQLGQADDILHQRHHAG